MLAEMDDLGFTLRSKLPKVSRNIQKQNGHKILAHWRIALNSLRLSLDIIRSSAEGWYLEKLMAVFSARSTNQQDVSFLVTQIHILPSKSSIGYVVSFYAKPSAGEPDGWYPDAYASIRGLARLPESVGTDEHHVWQRTVLHRLRRQGVEFLSREDADAYEKVWGRIWSIFWKTPVLRTIVAHLDCRRPVATAKGSVEESRRLCLRAFIHQDDRKQCRIS
ncbi:MAG: hypothetical protein ACXWLB_12255 [Reyranella sp.]